MNAWRRLKTAGRIGVGFAAMLALLGTVGAIELWATSRLEHDLERMSTADGVALLTSDIDIRIASALLHTHAYFASDDEQSLAEARHFLEQADEAIETAEGVATPEQAVLVEQMHDAVHAFVDGLAVVSERVAHPG